LIDDLEFFISNLEAISTRLRIISPSSSTMSSPTIQPNPPNWYAPAHQSDPKNGSTAGASLEAVGGANETNPQYSQPKMATRENSQQQPVLQSPNNSGPYTEQGHYFEVQSAEGKSKVVHGSIDNAMLQPAPVGQVLSYQVRVAKDNAVVVGGAMSGASFQSFINN